MKKVFYSQYGQDRFLEKYLFKKINKGFFVDIGANDGITFSNTYFFEKKGWGGICIEPIENVFINLQKNRSSKCFMGVVSGEESDFVDFLHISGEAEMLSGILSKCNNDHTKRIEQEVNNKGDKNVIKVKNYNFNNIVGKLGIDYLSIDTEGAELEILKSIDFSKYNIKAITVENNYKDKDINDFLLSNNFFYVISLGCDDLYVNKESIKMVRNKFLFNINRGRVNLIKKIKNTIKSTLFYKKLKNIK